MDFKTSHKVACRAIAEGKLPKGSGAPVVEHLTAAHFGGQESLLEAWKLSERALNGDQEARNELRRLAEEGQPSRAHHTYFYARFLVAKGTGADTKETAQKFAALAADLGHACAASLLAALHEKAGRHRYAFLQHQRAC